MNSRFMTCAALLCGAFLSASWLTAATAAEPLDVGAKAADFELPIVGEDEYLRLSDARKQGPVVVVVLRGYPGYQCPLCSRQVGDIVNRAKVISKLVSKVVLVYPGSAGELEQHAEEFMGSRTLPEPILMVRDPDMTMVEEWGLRWKAPNETAYPATYVIDRSGRVAWKRVSDSHAGRSNVEEILKALRKL